MKQVREISRQEKMIQQQLQDRGIQDTRVLEAMRHIPREQFFPAGLREHAHADRAAPIGHGQTISQPYIVALMSERLEIRPEHRVLEIGTGSGYQTAVLARLGGQIYTMERVKPLLDAAFERLMSLEVRNIHLRYGDGTKGWPEAAPFDRILIAAGAPELPRKLLSHQLVDGGLAVVPVGPSSSQMLIQVKRHGEKLETKEICSCRFVKLIGEGAWPEP